MKTYEVVRLLIAGGKKQFGHPLEVMATIVATSRRAARQEWVRTNPWLATELKDWHILRVA